MTAEFPYPGPPTTGKGGTEGPGTYRRKKTGNYDRASSAADGDVTSAVAELDSTDGSWDVVSPGSSPMSPARQVRFNAIIEEPHPVIAPPPPYPKALPTGCPPPPHPQMRGPPGLQTSAVAEQANAWQQPPDRYSTGWRQEYEARSNTDWGQPPEAWSNADWRPPPEARSNTDWGQPPAERSSAIWGQQSNARSNPSAVAETGQYYRGEWWAGRG